MDQKKELALFTPFPLVVTPQIHRAFYFPSLCCYFLSQKKQDVALLCENSFVRVKCQDQLCVSKEGGVCHICCNV